MLASAATPTNRKRAKWVRETNAGRLESNGRKDMSKATRIRLAMGVIGAGLSVLAPRRQASGGNNMVSYCKS